MCYGTVEGLLRDPFDNYVAEDWEVGKWAL